MMHEVKQPLRLVGGKFMRGDVEEAPEIGNREQIELLQKHEREVTEREQECKENGLEVDICVKNIRYDALCEFTCICGEEIEEVDNYCETDSFEDLEEPGDFEGCTVTCKACGREYGIYESRAKLLLR